MTFPKRDILQNKEKLESDLVDLFKKTDSWSEFCIKAETHYGTDVSSFFGKWHIGYVALNVGRSFVIVPMMLISMALTAVTAFFACRFMSSNPAFMLLSCMTVGVLFATAFAKILKFNEFCDRLEGMMSYV